MFLKLKINLEEVLQNNLFNYAPTFMNIGEKSIKVKDYVDLKQVSTKIVISNEDIDDKSIVNKDCWWCREHCVNSIGIPIIYRKIESEGEIYHCFKFQGNTCKMSCSKSYILKNSSNPYYKESLMLLDLFYYLCNGEYVDIPTVLGWEWKDKYGGILNINDYEKYKFYKESDIKLFESKKILIEKINKYIES